MSDPIVEVRCDLIVTGEEPAVDQVLRAIASQAAWDATTPSKQTTRVTVLEKSRELAP